MFPRTFYALPLVALTACGGSSPTTPTPPTAARFTVTGNLRTAAPSSQPKGSVWVQYIDESTPREWKKVWVPYENSTFTLNNVQAGEVRLHSTAGTFLPAELTFTLSGNRQVELVFTPEPKTIERPIHPASFSRCPSSWNAGSLCQAMQLVTHHSGEVSALLTWNATLTSYRAELWRGDSVRIAESTPDGVGRARLTGQALGGQFHYLRLLPTQPVSTQTIYGGVVTLPN